MKLKNEQMKNVQKVCWLLVISVLALVFYVQAAGAEVLVDEIVTYPSLTQAAKCTDWKVFDYSVPGTGGVVVTKYMVDPFINDDRAGRAFGLKYGAVQYKSKYTGFTGGVLGGDIYCCDGDTSGAKSRVIQNGNGGWGGGWGVRQNGEETKNPVGGIPLYDSWVTYQDRGRPIDLQVAVLPVCWDQWVFDIQKFNQAAQETRLIIEFIPDSDTSAPPVSQPSTNSKTLAVGETWNVGEGYTITANAIDAKSGQIWLVLSKNGKKLDDSTVNVGETYTYNNLKIKVTKISAGAVSDTVILTDESSASSTTGITPGVTVPSPTTCYDNGMGAPGGNCIYSNGNAGGVYNNPTSQTIFTLTNTYNVMSISTYHYNSGSGATPGTISLKDSSGKTVGTWTATGRYGNFYWDVTPNIKLGPGTYTVIDSDTSTWAQNSETNNQGMFIVKGTLATTSVTTPKPGATTTQGTTGDFTVSISPTEMTVNPGENIRFTLTVEPEGDFNEPVEIYVKTEALGQEKNFGRVKTIYPPYKPYVFESAVPDSIPKGTTITGYVTAKGGGLERDAGTVIVNIPGFGTLLAIGALGIAILLRKRR